MTEQEAIKDLLEKATTEHLLSIDGMYELLSEHYNNEIVELIEKHKTKETIEEFVKRCYVTPYAKSCGYDTIRNKKVLNDISNIFEVQKVLSDNSEAAISLSFSSKNNVASLVFEEMTWENIQYFQDELEVVLNKSGYIYGSVEKISSISCYSVKFYE